MRSFNSHQWLVATNFDILQIVFLKNLATSPPLLLFLNPLIQPLHPLSPPLTTLPTQQPEQMVVRMSMAASSVPCTTRVLSPSTSSTSYASSSSSSPPSLKFSARARLAVIRSSKAEGPLRRPMAPAAPPLQPPPSTSPPKPAPVVAPAEAGRGGVVTLEFQRKMAKEMQEYFRLKKVEETDQGPVFGFLGKNEIANGRWAMFGFAVGLLTEYATGSSFVDQLKILLSNFGIVD